MQKAKFAFTMIELVFVIVILGILAAVAIPKLTATRDDALISRAAQNIVQSASEISTYAVTKGYTDINLSVMSNGIVALEDSGDAVLSPQTAVIGIGTVSDCVTIQVATGINDENLTMSFGNPGADKVCKKLQDLVGTHHFPMQIRGTLVKN